MNVPIIDKEFASAIPPLQPADKTILEQSIRAEGCRDALIVWKQTGILLDGHNRLTICQEHNLSYKVTEIELADRQTALKWMLLNQLGRRNLTPYQRGVLALKLKPIIQAEAKEHEKAGGGSGVSGRQKSDNPVDTKKEVAKLADISHDTLKKIEVLETEADADLKCGAMIGELSVNAAYNTHRHRQRANSVTVTTGELATSSRVAVTLRQL